MVQTRSQWRHWRDNNFRSQSSQNDNANEYQHGQPSDRVDNSHEYSNNTDCNRHRPSDNQPYTEQVIAYRRRKPI